MEITGNMVTVTTITLAWLYKILKVKTFKVLPVAVYSENHVGHQH